MSYRLINANALVLNHAEVNDLPCIYADLPNGLDGGYYDLARDNADKGRWHELFGTPERAMRVIALIGERYPCDDGCDPLGEKCKVCPFANAPSCRIDRDHPEESPLLEWLRGDA